MLRLGTVALLGMALSLALPVWAGSDGVASNQAPNSEGVVAVDSTTPQSSAEEQTSARDEPTEPGRYRVGARVEGVYRFAHPYGVPPQVLPILPPAGLSGLGL